MPAEQPSAKEQLTSLFKRTADAIREKDGTIEEIDKIYPEDYPDRIKAIQTGIDTSDADAAPEDIVSGKTAYVDGEKVTGTLTAVTSGSTLPTQSGSMSAVVSGSNLAVTTTVEGDVLVKDGTEIKTEVPLSDFGNATAEDVLADKTFTSAEGYNVIGKLRASSPTDPVEDGSTLPSQSGSTSISTSGSNLSITTTVTNDTLIKGGNQIKMEVPLSDFGDATTSDVLSGKTFTSTSGVKQTGTIATQSSSSLYASGRTVTVPAGYYPSQVSKSISTATQATPTISQSGTTITATSTQSAGYVSAGTKTATLTLSSAGSISGTLGVTGSASWSTSDPNRGSGTVSIKNVNQTAGYTSGYSDGSFSVTVPANRLLKGRTITPGTSKQLVGNAEDILYGAINVAGDSNLVASNIKSGVSIFGVSGSLSGGSISSMRGSGIHFGSISPTSVMLMYEGMTTVSNFKSKHICTWLKCRSVSTPYHYFCFFLSNYAINYVSWSGYIYGDFHEINVVSTEPIGDSVAFGVSNWSTELDGTPTASWTRAYGYSGNMPYSDIDILNIVESLVIYQN